VRTRLIFKARLEVDGKDCGDAEVTLWLNADGDDIGGLVVDVPPLSLPTQGKEKA